MSYAYDANGNMTSKVNGADTTTYEYDYENRLKKATLPNGTVTEYKYDPFGRRIEEKVTVGGVSTITRNLYDGDNILNEYDGNGVLQTGYIHNLGIDEPLSVEKGGNIYYYHRDGLGSVTALTDATGAKVQSYEYDSFGNITSQTGTLDQPYTYTGREYDPETGLYYYRARYYDARLGRFISKDPIGFAGGDVNVYNYTRGNPVNWVDPEGKLAFYWHVGITYVAARNSDYNIMDSLSLAVNAAAVDFNGSQGTSPSDTVQHAMAADGQSRASAITATKAYIQSSINSGNLAGAIHAAQDLATPGHAGIILPKI